MLNLHDVAVPGLMLSQTWPTSRECEGETLRALETAVASDFFRAYQSVEVPYAAERKQIARIVATEGVFYDYCAARVLNEGGLSLSDLDESNRERSCDEVVRCLDHAREAGAAVLTVVSGPGPADPNRRNEALRALERSLRAIAREASRTPSVGVVIEPLDVVAHKKHTLGYTAEAVTIIRTLRDEGLNVSLLLDAAHIALNGERALTSLEEALDLTTTFHYCNCVVDRTHPMFGDRHIRFGDPGILDQAGVAELMRGQLEIGFFSTQRKRVVMCEVLLQDGESSHALMAYCRDMLAGAWELARDAQAAPAAL
jgi:sugar phosphate isomerase/epimerase